MQHHTTPLRRGCGIRSGLAFVRRCSQQPQPAPRPGCTTSARDVLRRLKAARISDAGHPQRAVQPTSAPLEDAAVSTAHIPMALRSLDLQLSPSQSKALHSMRHGGQDDMQDGGENNLPATGLAPGITSTSSSYDDDAVATMQTFNLASASLAGLSNRVNAVTVAMAAAGAAPSSGHSNRAGTMHASSSYSSSALPPSHEPAVASHQSSSSSSRGTPSPDASRNGKPSAPSRLQPASGIVGAGKGDGGGDSGDSGAGGTSASSSQRHEAAGDDAHGGQWGASCALESRPRAEGEPLPALPFCTVQDVQYIMAILECPPYAMRAFRDAGVNGPDMMSLQARDMHDPRFRFPPMLTRKVLRVAVAWTNFCAVTNSPTDTVLTLDQLLTHLHLDGSKRSKSAHHEAAAQRVESSWKEIDKDGHGSLTWEQYLLNYAVAAQWHP